MNYWMFRVSEKFGGNRVKFCLNNNLVYCGWNLNMTRDQKEILKQFPWASKMAIKFTYIKEDDIVIMPTYLGIAIGKVTSKPIYREDLDWKDTLTVKWLTKFYPRKNLSSKFQSKLKYFGTFLNLNNFSHEINDVIDNPERSFNQKYSAAKEDIEIKEIESLTAHINKRSNLHFQDREFELFILHLFELEYGLTGTQNNQKQEAKDRKDLTLGIDYDDFDINIKINIQVKQHENKENNYAINQISKSDASDPYTKNVVVSTAFFSDKLKEEAKQKDVTLFGPSELARIIYNNFEQIDENYKAKLKLYSSVGIFEKINMTSVP